MRGCVGGVMAVLLAAAQGAAAAPVPPLADASGPFHRWRHSRAVVLDTSPAGAAVKGDVPAFPLALSLDGGSFDFSQARPDGADLRFSTMDGRALPHTVERWDPAARTAAVWVKVDVRGDAAGQSLLMHWGHPDAPNLSDPRAVFDTRDGFVGVWHLGDQGGTAEDGYLDATANGAHGTGVNLTVEARVKGRVGDAVALRHDKGQWIHVAGEKRKLFDLTDRLTFSIWARAAGYRNKGGEGERPLPGYETMFAKGDNSWRLQKYGIREWHQPPADLVEICVERLLPKADLCVVGKTDVAPGEWFHFTGVHDHPRVKLYVNGALESVETFDSRWQSGDYPVGIGNQSQFPTQGRFWDGLLDEARVLDVVKDEHWIKLDYESQRDGQKLVHLGEVMTRSSGAVPAGRPTFGEEVAFLKRHTPVVVLADPASGARVAVAPALQGRVMTSAARGDASAGFGWINREILASGRRDPHIHAYGGEDRFWLGPEGGQFSLFFAKGAPFDLAHWHTPAPVDTEPYPVTAQAEDHVSFRKRMALTNYAGFRFDLALDRTVRLVPAGEAWRDLGLDAPPGVEVVAYESRNTITNAGTRPWRKETGLVSVWILGMFKPSPATTVVVPFRPGPEATLGPVVNDAYFGKVPPGRLLVRDRVLFFRGDGAHRSKIGITPARAEPVLGSYDAEGRVLTLVQFDRPVDAEDYVNSMWEIQADPYGGDVVNSYNDGPPAPGIKPLGPFYELETSSPAAALRPGESLTHRHRTLHVVGEERALDQVARAVLGVGLGEITGALAARPGL
ncbi:MAG TPA: DUF6786 family protein [Vicinamibacteria bacterium]|nr:DUF6786 family protein [Vicinamibacteria bacterium]